MTKASVSCAPYFRNYTSIIWLSFMVHMCKMIISPDVAIIFSKFWFLWSSVGLKGKKWSRMTKKCVCHAPYLRTMHHMIVICGTQVYNDDIFRCFFHFSKFCFFSDCWWGKRAQKGPKWQKRPWCSIFQEPYIIWLSFMGHICKMRSPLRSFFQKFWFSGLLVKEQKTVQNDENFFLSYSISQEPYIIWLSFMVHICKMISPSVAFIFSKFWFLGSSGGWKGKKQAKMTNNVCLVLYLNHKSYDCHLWCTFRKW